jgi:hypothetical protein
MFESEYNGMPFFADIDADDDVLRRPIWGTLSLIKDNLERLIAINICWSIQMLPAIAALGFPSLPTIIRILLIIYSATALAPATGILFTWIARISRNDTVRLDMLKDDFRQLALPSIISLAPLFGCLGICYEAILLLGFAHILILDVLMRFILLLLLVCAMYWGPFFAEYPKRSPFFLMQQSLSLAWHYPGPTALTMLIVLGAAALGIFSICGFFLIAPVLIALFQTRRCLELLERKDARQARLKVGTA